MRKPLGMLPPPKMMDLILQSVEKSDVFRSEWDKNFVRIVLDMYLTKGDFPHFVEYYGEKVDRNDFESYFKDTILSMFDFDDECYKEIEDEFFGDENEK